MAELFGVEASILSPEEAFEKWPLIRTDDLLGAAWLPHVMLSGIVLVYHYFESNSKMLIL